MNIRVRQEVVLGTGISQRILYASDLHLNPINGAAPALALCVEARRLKPDRIVLGGDLVDVRAQLPTLGKAMDTLRRIAPVHVLPGNHDQWPGLDRLRSEVLKSGCTWHPSGVICFHPNVRNWELSKDIAAQSFDDALVCVHDPAHLESLPVGWRVGIAGHLHGGQVILWKNRIREFPGAWISRWNGPRFEDQGRTILVSRGIADTLPIRWNCPREIILCETR